MSTLVAMATVHDKFQMTFPIKVLRQFLWNFIFSIHMLVVQNLAKKIIFRNSRWPPCPYMVKTVQTTSSPKPLCQLD